MLQRGREAAAHHVAEHVEDHHVGVFEQVVFLQQLDGLAHHVAAAAGAGRRAAGLDTHHPVVAREDEVLDAQFLGMEVDRLEHVDHGGQHLLGQREGAVVFRVAADLQHPLAHLREGRRQVAAGGALADASLAVDREHLGGADLQVRVELHLHAALAVGTGGGRAAHVHPLDLTQRDGGDVHAVAPSRSLTKTPSSRSSSSSPARRSASSMAGSGFQYWRSDASSRRLANLAEDVGFRLARRSRIAGSSMKVSVSCW